MNNLIEIDPSSDGGFRIRCIPSLEGAKKGMEAGGEIGEKIPLIGKPLGQFAGGVLGFLFG